MGHYTELNVSFRLKGDTPQEVLDVLKYLCSPERPNEPTELPDHPFFKTERWRSIGRGSSSYFPADSSCYLEGRYGVAIRCNIKNYNDEIRKFLSWIQPYLLCSGFIGFIRDEEYNLYSPTLLYAESQRYGGPVEIVQVEGPKPRSWDDIGPR